MDNSFTTAVHEVFVSFVFSPSHTRLMCAYGRDGQTRGKTCTPPGRSETCIPACIPQFDQSTGNSRNEYDRWCDNHLPKDYICGGRPWRPRDVGKMLARDRRSWPNHDKPRPWQMADFMDGYKCASTSTTAHDTPWITRSHTLPSSCPFTSPLYITCSSRVATQSR